MLDFWGLGFQVAQQMGLIPRLKRDGYSVNLNYETKLFDVATGKRLHTLNRRGTREIAFSRDGKTLAAGYVDGMVALWDVASGELRARASACEEVFSLDWNPQGDLLVTGGTDWKSGKITLWDPKKLRRLNDLDVQRILYLVLELQKAPVKFWPTRNLLFVQQRNVAVRL